MNPTWFLILIKCAALWKLSQCITKSTWKILYKSIELMAITALVLRHMCDERGQLFMKALFCHLFRSKYLHMYLLLP